jgi:hypothetical protein
MPQLPPNFQTNSNGVTMQTPQQWGRMRPDQQSNWTNKFNNMQQVGPGGFMQGLNANAQARIQNNYDQRMNPGPKAPGSRSWQGTNTPSLGSTPNADGTYGSMNMQDHSGLADNVSAQMNQYWGQLNPFGAGNSTLDPAYNAQTGMGGMFAETGGHWIPGYNYGAGSQAGLAGLWSKQQPNGGMQNAANPNPSANGMSLQQFNSAQNGLGQSWNLGAQGTFQNAATAGNNGLQSTGGFKPWNGG